MRDDDATFLDRRFEICQRRLESLLAADHIGRHLLRTGARVVEQIGHQLLHAIRTLDDPIEQGHRMLVEGVAGILLDEIREALHRP